MKRGKLSFLAFAAICAVTPFVVRPVTVVELTAASPGEVHVTGWTQMGEAGPRTGLEARTTPFRLVFKGRGLRAHFSSREEGQRFQVRAARKRAWLPLVRVGGAGATISLESTGAHLRLSAQ